MAKAPRIGRVKTRLSQDIGRVGAWATYRALLSRTFQELSGSENWCRIAYVTPDRAVWGRPFWPSGWQAMAQPFGDLGQRMAHPLYILPPGPVVLVGTDIPDLEKTHIREAFDLLQTHDAVFGPAADGGFWLVGFARRKPLPKGLYRGVHWSSSEALSQTLATIGKLKVGYTATLSDFDTLEDYHRQKKNGLLRGRLSV